MSVMDGQNGMGRSAFLRANGATVGGMLQGYSLEVLPRTAAKIESFKALLPVGTRVYIANVEGTDFEDMIQTARRIRGEGFDDRRSKTAFRLRQKLEAEEEAKKNALEEAPKLAKIEAQRLAKEAFRQRKLEERLMNQTLKLERMAAKRRPRRGPARRSRRRGRQSP